MGKLYKGATGKVRKKEREKFPQKMWKQKDGILGEMTSRK